MKRRREDPEARFIRFGVELETVVPVEASIAVGCYHQGEPVRSGRVPGEIDFIAAPSFGGKYWRGDRDASVEVVSPWHHVCEFVSPVLFGATGVETLRDFVRFANSVDASVNASCGCHVTIGIKSVIGTGAVYPVSVFLRKLIRVVKLHAWAVYAQTGTDRHTCKYAAEIPVEARELSNDLVRDISISGDPQAFGRQIANECKRGMLNLKKAFPDNPDEAAVEFRAFAGTLNEHKILHHVATCLGLVRRAATLRLPPVFTRSNHRDAPAALRALWSDLGWLEDGPGPDCALGQFGLLYSEFPNHAAVALKMAQKFEAKAPNARL
jgi:hypothetical protein